MKTLKTQVTTEEKLITKKTGEKVYRIEVYSPKLKNN